MVVCNPQSTLYIKMGKYYKETKLTRFEKDSLKEHVLSSYKNNRNTSKYAYFVLAGLLVLGGLFSLNFGHQLLSSVSLSNNLQSSDSFESIDNEILALEKDFNSDAYILDVINIKGGDTK